MAPTHNPRLKIPARADPNGNGNGNGNMGTPPNPTSKAPASPMKRKTNARGGAHDSRIEKKQPFLEKLGQAKKAKAIDALTTSITAFQWSAGPAEHKPFRFLDLPGELRNAIYRLAIMNTKQALLVHLPRRASLRPRRAVANYADVDDDDQKPSKKKSKAKDKAAAKMEPTRPFFYLTQVCRQIRAEYRPIYMLAQETGMDFTCVGKFVDCFYPPSTRAVASASGATTPFLGNLTIALASTLKSSETGVFGTNILPLLDTWANSERIEAGFGRYHNSSRGPYNPETDGEAKDLYRLFGRKVETGRKCGRMNLQWRAVLRGRWLAEVRVVRQPEVGNLNPAQPFMTNGRPTPPTTPTTPNAPVNMALGNPPLPVLDAATNLVRPYFHILYKPQFRASWMDSEDAAIPAGWLEHHGFGTMEHFYVKVGAVGVPVVAVAQAPKKAVRGKGVLGNARVAA